MLRTPVSLYNKATIRKQRVNLCEHTISESDVCGRLVGSGRANRARSM